MTGPYRASAGVAATLLTLAGLPAHGAEAASSSTGLEPVTGAPFPSTKEIIVTARKRAERLSEVGMSITAVGQAELVEKGITTPAGLTRIEPSLQFTPSPTGTPIYTIRGVGYFEQSLAATPAVSLYQDEAPYLYPLFAKGALLDLDHVEILKGPQGILFGQNVTGGAIELASARPTSRLATGVNATYGRFGAAHIDGFVSGPLTSTFSARLVLSLDGGGAWQKSETRDDALGRQDLKTGRLILEWRPNDALKASLNLNGFRDRSDAQAAQLFGYYFGAPQNISPVTPAQLATPAGYFPNPAFLASYPKSIQTQLAEPMTPSSNQQADWIAGTHPRLDETYGQAVLRIDYATSAGLALAAITSFERYTQHDRSDAAAEAAPTDSSTINGHVRSFYQEVRAQGDALGHRLNWLLGANYEDDLSTENAVADPFDTSGSFLTGGSSFSPVQIAPFTVVGGPSRVEARTAAIFANLDYRITTQVVGHAGIRYTQSDQKFAGCTTAGDPLSSVLLGVPAGACATSLPDGGRGLYATRLNQSNLPWRVSLDWTIIPETLLYASISQGYKAGTSPNLGAETYRQLTPVRQEALLAYEVGLKAMLFDRTLSLTADVFHYDYRDKQELGRFLDPIFGDLQALVNVPRSREDGAEVAAAWRPFRGLALSAAATWLDSRVVSDFFNYGPYVLGPADTVNFRSEAFPFTPKWSLNSGARYDWPLSSALAAFVGVDGSYQTRTSSAFGDTAAHAEGPALANKAYGLLNLAAGVASTDGLWRVEVWGENVTDTYYWTSAFYNFDPVVRFTGRPATYGVTLSFRH